MLNARFALVFTLGLLACSAGEGAGTDDALLAEAIAQEQLDALDAQHAADQAELEALRHQVQELDQRLTRLEQASAPTVGQPALAALAVPDGPRCGEAGTLPDDALSAEQVAKAMRLVPHKGADGQIDGFRLSGIRRNSLIDSCGFKNGDIVHAVNGVPLTTPAGALSAYEQLKDATRFTFTLTRRGQAHELALSRSL